MSTCGGPDITFFVANSGFFAVDSFRRRSQQQPVDAPAQVASRAAKDVNDLKLNGSLPEAYEVDMHDSDVRCELLEFGLVGGPQPYQSDALWKVPSW